MPNHQDRRDPLPADYQFPTPQPEPPVDAVDDPNACPVCHGPSTRGGICFNCVGTPAETPWAV